MSGYKYYDDDYKVGGDDSWINSISVQPIETQQLNMSIVKLNEAIQTLLNVYENLEEGKLKKEVYITLDKITDGDMDFITIEQMRQKWK